MTEDGGFTLIELVVSMAILGIVILGLAQLYTSVTLASHKTAATSAIHRNVSFALNQIASRLRSAANNRSSLNRVDYKFVGFDGDPGGFENQVNTPHQQLVSSNQPNNVSDRLHFHGFLDDATLDDPELRSNRVYYAFWINGEGSENTKAQLKGRWGILVRRIKHQDAGTVLPSLLLDLNESGTSHTSVDPLALDVDFLKFEFYDSENKVWVEEWDSRTLDDNRFPSAVRVAIRGYDDEANETGTSNRRLADPVWLQTTVSLNSTGS